jgi:hypothetical protein
VSFTIYQSEIGLRMENGQLKQQLAAKDAEINRLRALVGEAPLEQAAPLQSDAYAHVASSGATIGRRPQAPAISSVNGSISVDMPANQEAPQQQQAQAPQQGQRPPQQYAPQPQTMRPAMAVPQPPQTMARPNVPLAAPIHTQGNEGQSVTIGQYGGSGATGPTGQVAAVNPMLQARIDAARARAAQGAPGQQPVDLPVAAKVDADSTEDDSSVRFSLLELGGPSR